MSKDKLRSRKKLEKQILEARAKDQEADEILNKQLKSILQLCRDKDVEPETVLYRLGIITHIARAELAKKHRAQFLDEKDDLGDKKQLKLIHEDYSRLVQTIYDQSVQAQEGGEKHHTKDPRSSPSGGKRPTASKGNTRLPGYA